MIGHLIVAVTTLLLFESASAQHWVALPFSDVKVEIDANSVRQSGSTVVFTQRMQGTNDVKVTQYLRANCELRSSQPVRTSYLTLDGKEWISNSGTEQYYPPKSVGAAVIDFACSILANSAYHSPEMIDERSRTQPIKLAPPSLNGSSTFYEVPINKRIGLQISQYGSDKQCLLSFKDEGDIPFPLLTFEMKSSKRDQASFHFQAPLDWIKEGTLEISEIGQPSIVFDIVTLDRSQMENLAMVLASKFYLGSSRMIVSVNRKVVTPGGERMVSSFRNSAIGFRLLWDVAVQECGFPKILQDETLPPDPKKLNRKSKIM